MTNAEQTIKSLARLDPDYHAFVAALPPELSHTATALPPELADDVVSLLRTERPKLFEKLDQQAAAPPDKLGFDPISMGLVAAILFLLQSHIKIEGKHFIIDHPPMDNELLKSVLEQVGKFLDMIGGGQTKS